MANQSLCLNLSEWTRQTIDIRCTNIWLWFLLLTTITLLTYLLTLLKLLDSTDLLSSLLFTYSTYLLYLLQLLQLYTDLTYPEHFIKWLYLNKRYRYWSDSLEPHILNSLLSSTLFNSNIKLIITLSVQLTKLYNTLLLFWILYSTLLHYSFLDFLYFISFPLFLLILWLL